MNIIKNYEKILLNLVVFCSLILLFVKFFLLEKVYPLSDEIIAIERNAEWHNFLWRNNVGNHTINSFFAVVIKSILGENLLYYRFISFLFFSFILILFKKLYPSILLCCAFILIIISSQLLTNYIWIFRGYYSWAFFTVLNFFYLKKFSENNFDNKNYNILLVINLVLLCHSLFTLYIVIPVFISLSLIFLKDFIIEDKNFNRRKKLINFFLFFLIPASIFYFLITVIEGFTIFFSDNLNLKFLLLNLFDVVREGFIPGFKNIFLNSHLDKFINEKNFLNNLFKSLSGNTFNGDDTNLQTEPQFTILIIYIISLIILLYRAFYFKLKYLDLVIVNIFLFFFFMNYIPEPRVHVGIVFFNVFYIADNIINVSKKIKNHFTVILPLLFLTFYLLSKTEIDKKILTTKIVIDKIASLKSKHSCYELNYLFNDEEIWIMKNFYKKDCNSYYDRKNEKNVLF